MFKVFCRVIPKLAKHFDDLGMLYGFVCYFFFTIINLLYFKIEASSFDVYGSAMVIIGGFWLLVIKGLDRISDAITGNDAIGPSKSTCEPKAFYDDDVAKDNIDKKAKLIAFSRKSLSEFNEGADKRINKDHDETI